MQGVKRIRIAECVVAALAAGLLVASAAGDRVTYGADAAMGCQSPTVLGQKMSCFYVFGNFDGSSHDTVLLQGAVDTVQTAAGPVTSPDRGGGDGFLPDLPLVFKPDAGTAGAPTCSGGSGLGTLASPYVGATSCLVPFGATVSSSGYGGFYTPTAADFALPNHRLPAQIDFTWTDTCDLTPTPDTCSSIALNDSQAPASTVILQYTPAITTVVVPPGPIAVGSTAHDTASITFDRIPPSVAGTVTYQLFGNADCTGLVQDLTPAANAYTGGAVPDSKPFTFTNAGTYYFRATFSGDPAHGVPGPVSTACAAEPIVVSPNAPSITTLVVPAGPISTGASARDTAALHNATPAAGGTVTYTLYSNSTCSGAGTDLTPAASAVVNGSVPDSKPFTFNTAGTFYFVASYSGDTNNTPARSGCTAEPLTVSGGGGGGSPAISITKNPKSQTILSGGTAGFTITVGNTGDLTLLNVSVSDPLAPNCSKTSADIPALASMAPGATVTYNCSLADVTQGLTNEATATGTGSNGQTVTAQDTATVTVTAPQTPPTAPAPKPAVKPPAPKPKPAPQPKIAIVKEPAIQSIATGSTATFKITVTNTGNTTLRDVTVTDPRSRDCDRRLGAFAAGDSKTYSCTRTEVAKAFVNVATATGKPPTGPPVTASDQAQVKVQAFVPPQHPRIAIAKSPKHQELITKVVTTTTANGAHRTNVTYGGANFTVRVTNTGDVTLHRVHVADPEAAACVRDLGTLAAGQSKTYACTRATVARNFVNVAIATGVSPKGVKVRATDHANVTVEVQTSAVSGAKFTG